MRAAGAKLKELYGTQLGQDTIETLLGASISAGGQALFTDMTPEEIAVATILGMGAATIGRPLVGRIGQTIGTRVAKNDPKLNEVIAHSLRDASTTGPAVMQEAIKAKLRPYAHLPAAAQYGQLLGRGSGDNIVQGLVGLAAPLVVGSDENA